MKVRIDIYTRQTIDGDSELLELHEEGMLRTLPNGRHVLSFIQDGVHNELQINAPAEEISLIRNRRREKAVVYKQNTLHRMAYETPVGEMELEFDTHCVEICPSRGDRLLELRLVYRILQAGSPVSDNELRIRVRPF